MRIRLRPAARFIDSCARAFRGRTLLVVGDGEVLKVHVRTGRPDLALGIDLDCGAVDDIVLKAEARSVLVA